MKINKINFITNLLFAMLLGAIIGRVVPGVGWSVVLAFAAGWLVAKSQPFGKNYE